MLLIQNAHIKTMAGADIPNGCLLVEDGKIAAVAPEIDAPADAKVIDAQGRLLTPGCVEAHCHIGLDNQSMRWEGMDYNEIVDPLTPQLRAIDSINPQDEAFPNAIRGGVTTACTGPGSANVVGGTFAILKLAGKHVDKMVLRSPAAMKCAFGENPKGCYGQGKKQSPMTRMAVAGLLRELLMRTIRYRDDKAAGKNPPLDVKLEAMLPVVNREIPIKCHAHRADDILTAVRIAREFDLKLTLDHCTDGEIIADELAAECDFFSIGTNDLTQYTCALDRQNAKLEPFFNPHHPAVLRAIKMTIEAGHRHGIWVGICGELGADTALTETFLRMGVDELSMNAKSILPVRKIIRSVDLSKPSEK